MAGGERNQFGRQASENPNTYPLNFLTKCNIKLNGVSADTILLRFFLLSLIDRAYNWLENEEPNSFTT